MTIISQNNRYLPHELNTKLKKAYASFNLYK